MVVQPSGKNIAKPQAEYDDPTIEYPYEDDELLAETEHQYVPLTYAVAALKAYFSGQEDIYAQGDMFVYFRMNDPSAVVAPDVFLVKGARGRHKRNSWFTWREGDVAPCFVMEIASESTWQWDATGKRDIYAHIGVDEYWRFDPTGECFSPPLAGGRLVDGEYRSIGVAKDEDGILRGHSELLGLDIYVLPGLELRLYDPERDEWLLSYEEQIAAREAAEAAREAERTAREAAEAEREIKREAFQSERQAREAAEQRIRELEAQLLRQQGNDSS